MTKCVASGVRAHRSALAELAVASTAGDVCWWFAGWIGRQWAAVLFALDAFEELAGDPGRDQRVQQHGAAALAHRAAGPA